MRDLQVYLDRRQESHHVLSAKKATLLDLLDTLHDLVAKNFQRLEEAQRQAKKRKKNMHRNIVIQDFEKESGLFYREDQGRIGIIGESDTGLVHVSPDAPVWFQKDAGFVWICTTIFPRLGSWVPRKHSSKNLSS
jgi:hypothetical protein